MNDLSKPIAKVLFVIILLFVTLSSSIVAQQQPNTCDGFVNQIISQLSTNCAKTEDGESCLGFEQATFVVEDEVDPILNPDQAFLLEDINSIQATEYDPAENEWGVVYMRGNANLAKALSVTNSLIYFVLGDTLIQNEVPEDEALILPDEPVSVRTSDTTSLYSFPPSFTDRESEALQSVSQGTALLADGISPEGWIRVGWIYQDTPVSRRSTAWIPGEFVEENEEIATLPLIDQNSLTPMQAFSMEASEVEPLCDDLPLSEILVQSPGNVEAEMFSNGLRIRIFSTVILSFSDLREEQIDSETVEQRVDLRIIPLVGHAFLPDSNNIESFEDGILIPAANQIDIPLIFDEETGVFALDPEFYDRFAEIKEDYDEARARGETLVEPSSRTRLFFWGRMAENLLNYEIEVFEILTPSGVGQAAPMVDGGAKPPLIFDVAGSAP